MKKIMFLVFLLFSVKMAKTQITYATSQTNSVIGLCLLCGVVDPNLPINNTNLTDYSSYAITAGLLGVSVEQTLIFPAVNTGQVGTDKIIIRVGADNALLTSSLFTGLRVETFNGSIANNDAVAASNVVTILSGGTAEITIKPAVRFDRVRLWLTSTLVGALEGYRNYYAYYEEDTPLPVNSDGLSVNVNADEVKLHWKTFSEQNNREFILYRASKDFAYKELVRIPAKANASGSQLYEYIDKNPLRGYNIYKLVQEDFDGKRQSLGERSINYNLKNLNSIVFPNPTKDISVVSIERSSFNKADLKDINGKTVITQSINPLDVELRLDLRNLNIGTYFLTLHGSKSLILTIVKN